MLPACFVNAGTTGGERRNRSSREGARDPHEIVDRGGGDRANWWVSVDGHWITPLKFVPGEHMRPNSILSIALIVVLAAVVVLPIVLGQSFFPPEPGRALAAAFVSGLIACSALELGKRLFGLRGWFQRSSIVRWFYAQTASEDSELAAKKGGPRTARFDTKAFAEFEAVVGLSGPTHDRERLPRQSRSTATEFYGMPIEQLSSQLARAGEHALARPGEYPSLLRVLAPGVADRYIESALDDEASEDPIRRKLVDSIAGAIESQVDLFQIIVGRRWRRFITLASIVIAGGAGYLIAMATEDGGWAAVAVLSVFVGGLTAWTLRDLMALIERARGGAF